MATVRAPTSVLAQIAAVNANVALPEGPKAIDEMVLAVAVNAGGMELTGLSVSPNLVRVQMRFVAGRREMSGLFGTDGVRGVANLELTPELAFRIGRAGAVVLHDGADAQRPIVVGRDTRISGSMLEAAIVADITSAGRNALLLGIVLMPAVASVARAYRRGRRRYDQRLAQSGCR